jgi:cation transport ATPase
LEAVVFDKTGTLTMGQLTVSGTTAAAGWNVDEVAEPMSR